MPFEQQGGAAAPGATRRRPGPLPRTTQPRVAGPPAASIVPKGCQPRKARGAGRCGHNGRRDRGRGGLCGRDAQRRGGRRGAGGDGGVIMLLR